jgi:hypothetical protein
MKIKISLLAISFALSINCPVDAQIQESKLTGNLYTDSKILFEQNKSEPLPQLLPQTENKKSPFLAGLFSLVVPGAGEVYAGSYWKAAIFLAVEAAVITTAIIYDKKGDDQTGFFQHYADENWSVVKYAEWIISTFYEGQDPGIITSNDTSLPPWKRVNWSRLNEAEREKNVGSHTLPPYADQQYYELIGKYFQFTAGWDDYTGGPISNFTPHLLYYAHEHAKADDYYSVASTAVIGIYINHFLSALDAVWTAIQHNNSLAVKLRMEQINVANRSELIPTIKLSYSF